MRYLSYQIIFFLFAISVFAQSPHGDSFDIDCSNCHTAESWKIDLTKIDFDHSKTNFALIGQHINVDCKSCHESLVFSKMDKDCFSCHKDIHQATVGVDCQSCHTPTTWIVKDIVGLHQKGRFPLLGAHKMADCAQCHSGYAELNFEPVNVDCYSCHEQNYESTQNPNHVAANFSTECQDCHNVSALSWNVTNVDHSFFPLVGGHALPSCFSCHQQGGNFSGLSQECYSCHQQTYEGTQNPNHIAAGMPTTCEVCHTIQSWAPAQFNHDLTAFPLTGKHIDTDCSNCHETGYTGTPTDCYACHTTDYNNTTNPNHTAVSFPTTCLDCHSTTAWEPATFDHDNQYFPIYSGKHKDKWTQCSECHRVANNYNLFSCIDCHEHNKPDMDNDHQGVQGYKYSSPDCLACHPQGRKEGSFNHATSSFPLTGLHLTASCADCHQNGYSGTSSICSDCHITSYNNSVNPNHTAAGLSTECSTCHNASGWAPSTFDHSSTGFTLLGAHQPLQCSGCHSGTVTGLTSDCVPCHQADYNTAANHTAQSYPINCEMCHNSVNWNETTFDHQTTSFPLTGEHITTDCQSCHTSGYTGTTTDCYACHTTDYNNTTNPNHTTVSFPTTCVDCHSTTAWEPATFDHDNQYFPIYSGKHKDKWTQCSECHRVANNYNLFSCIDCHEHNKPDMDNDHQGVQGYKYSSPDCLACHPQGRKEGSFNHATSSFPLTGLHLTASCADCHQNGYSGTSSICSDCHITSYNNSVNPNHTAAGLSTECSTCHNASGWTPSTFDHSSTGFTLLGAHQPLQCSGCHNGTVTGLTSDCVSCHQTDYNTAANHTAQAYPINCEMCHNSVNWNETTFDHQTTSFPLTGAHITTDCQSCHTSGYTGTTTDCYACHTTDFNNTTNPNHVAGSYPTTCVDCHSTTAWQPATFDHNTTQFPLTGAHTSTTCQSCHSSGYTNTPADCYACHTTDFNNTTNPNHVAESYPTTCVDCHSTTAWQPAIFDHNATQFPLTGAHTSTTCQSCHSSGYTNTPADCYACHTTDFNNTTNPNHVAANLPTTCVDCHSTTAWQPATFDHNTTQFPLTGAHSSTTCQSCHSSGYTNTPTDCYACHTTEYNNTTNPNHIAANFPTTCVDCHSTTAWEPATFDHDNQYFPIYSGSHNGKWNQCSECHTTPNNYSLFSCIDCHEHNRIDTDRDHQGVNGYVYNSINCYNCHPDGNDRPMPFNHSMSEFPLTGAHLNVECAQCHTSNQNRISTECVACHMQDYLKTLNPNHSSAGISTDCISCHKTNNWDSAFKMLQENREF
jgi:hypothetical protein